MSSRLLLLAALALGLSQAACASLAQPDEITIAAEPARPAKAPAPAAQPAPMPAPAGAAPAAGG